MINDYIKTFGSSLVYILAGAIAAMVIGSLFGAIGGLVLAFYNNLLPDSPNAAYIPSAYYVGYVIGIIAIFPGAIGGLLFAIMKVLLRRVNVKKDA